MRAGVERGQKDAISSHHLIRTSQAISTNPLDKIALRTLKLKQALNRLFTSRAPRSSPRRQDAHLLASCE